MKMLTVSLLVCAMMALTLASDLDGAIKVIDVLFEQGPCPKDWTHHNGRCYHLVSNPLPWAKAEKSCQSMKANLASVHSLEEDQFLQRMIIQADLYNPSTWIGASDCQQDDYWFWSNGKESTFRNYCESQVQEHGCILSNDGAKTCWVNRDCSFYQAYVCAFDM